MTKITPLGHGNNESYHVHDHISYVSVSLTNIYITLKNEIITFAQ